NHVALYGWASEVRSVTTRGAGKTERIVEAIPGGKLVFLFIRKGEGSVAESACDAHARRRRHTKHAGVLWGEPANIDGALRTGSADRMRKHCEPAAGPRNGAES